MAVEGLDDLLRRLDELPGAVDAAVEEALADGAQHVADLARSLAPVDAGALRSSIAVEGDGMALRVVAGGEATTRDGFDYSLAVEYGAEGHDAHPFLNPAARALAPSIVGRLARAVSSTITRAFR